MYRPIPSCAILLAVAACASTPEESDTPRAVIFSEGAMPTCDFETLGEISTTVRVPGDRETAERHLKFAIGRAAQRRGGDGVVGMVVLPGDRVAVVARRGERPSPADLPALEWTARGHAIRFTDPACRK